jgi:hypothetical protein
VFGHPARSLEFHHVRFFENPSLIGVREARFQIQAKTPGYRRSKQGDGKIAAIVDDIGKNGEGSA